MSDQETSRLNAKVILSLAATSVILTYLLLSIIYYYELSRGHLVSTTDLYLLIISGIIAAGVAIVMGIASVYQARFV